MSKVSQQIEYWKKSGERNWKTATGLFQLKRYDSCLFFCHLTIEKLLKGIVVQKIGKPAQFIHHLEKLSELAELKIMEEQRKNLRVITRFNIAGRYDDIKYNFYKIATKFYTKKYLDISNQLILWLKKQYLKN